MAGAETAKVTPTQAARRVADGLLFNEAQKSQDRVVRSYSLTPRSSLQEASVSIS